MKKILLSFLILFIFITYTGYIKSFDELDNFLKEQNGYRWLEKSSSSKLNFVEGFITGIQSAIENIEFWERISDNNKEEELLNAVISDIVSDYYLGGVTFGQFREGINEIYKNYANKQIPVHKLFRYVSKKVRGEMDDEQIEKGLQLLRRRYHLN